MTFHNYIRLAIINGMVLLLPALASVDRGLAEAKRVEVIRGDEEKLCDRLSEIKVLPFKGEPVDDEVYNRLVRSGREAIPCLLDKITDTSRMKDPRQAPTYHNFRVGDVAFFVFLRISGAAIEEMVPASVRRRFADEGVYAYFRYVETTRNRERLQQRCRAYFSKSSTK